MSETKLKVDALTFHYDNVGSLYGPHQVEWLRAKGHEVNEFNINDWQRAINKFNNSASDILMTWGVDQHTIGEFFYHLPKLNRAKYKQVVHFTTEPALTRFGFWMPDRNSVSQHNRYIESVKPTLICYSCREDFYLSQFPNKLWVCNNQYVQHIDITPWEQKQDNVAFSGKYRGWEDYQWPSYKGLGRSQQLGLVKQALGNRFVHYPPNTFKMNESLAYHNKHRYILSPRSGHIWHPRLSIAARIQSIPIIILPNECQEMKWFPELKHGHNCFLVKDSEIGKISEYVTKGSAEMASRVQQLQGSHNFNDSMGQVEKIISTAT